MLCAPLFVLIFFLSASSTRAADDARAAGRIDFEKTGGSCSASLVAPDVIVTAAHCALDAPEIAIVPGLTFVPGDTPGSPNIGIVQSVIHPLYDIDSPRIEWRFRFDLAALRLEKPLDKTRIAPFPLGDEARAGETLFIVSWRKADGPRPRQRACPVLDVGLSGLVTLGCPVVSGESGAPVLRRTESGLEIVAVVSSRTQLLDQPVAQASNLRLRLPSLLDGLAARSGS